MPVPFRIPVPLRSDGGYSVGALARLVPRDDQPNRHTGVSDRNSTLIVVVVLVIGVIIACLAGFVFLKRRAQERRKYKPTGNLEPYSNTTNTTNTNNNNTRRAGATRNVNAVSETNRDSTVSTVDRSTSIRSIMTLPRYTNTANEDEQVLGRAGERDGVDVIVEMPSAELQEALRDEEMETMYQIRRARRQQAAEREERLRLTQEARARGDTQALEELRSRRRTESTNPSVIEDLRETHGQIRTRRERAVSSVSYHDLGVARHDGSRIRANSNESERVGLLSDAASISLSTRSPSAMSNHRLAEGSGRGGPSLDTRSPSAHSHRRLTSVGSVVSLDDNEDVSPRSGAVTPRLGGSASGYQTRAGSSPEIVTEADLADSGMPPPDYEDVSLDDMRSGATTPMFFHEPPPDYSGHGHGDLGSPDGEDRGRRSSHLSPGAPSGVPHLPSLRISEVPQIVIEPSTAHPGR